MIRLYKEEDLTQINKILSDNWYEGCYLSDSKKLNTLVYLEDTKVLGIVAIHKATLDNYIELGEITLINDFIVLEDYRNRGIGSKLLSKAVEHFKNNNTMFDTNTVYAEVLERGVDKKALSLNLFIDENFELVKRVNDAWHGVGPVCAICGEDCHCSSLLYKLEIK